MTQQASTSNNNNNNSMRSCNQRLIITLLTLSVTTAPVAHSFTIRPASSSSYSSFYSSSYSSSTTQLGMGLFDGVKDAFAAPALERSVLDAERETPIDRWMGWSVVSENSKTGSESQVPIDFVDSMDASNYVTVALAKPMGIVFEENDEKYGGIFIQSIKDGSSAAAAGSLQEGDQLIAVNGNKVAGMAFDDALGTIVASTVPATQLTLFRGSARQFYGPTGPSQTWLEEFLASLGAKTSTPTTNTSNNN